MSREINRYIAQAIAEVAIFLEFSGEDIVHPDAAVEVFEQLASTLQMADPESKLSFCSSFLTVAERYSGEQAEFVKDLGEALGLTSE